MKVSIIVGGRFHAFNLAEQLYKKKYLKKLITSYPKTYIKNNFNIDKEFILSLPLKEILFRTLKKIKIIDDLFDLDLITSRIFADRVCKIANFDDTDIVVGWSSFSLKSFEKSKKSGCINILERGSTHIEFQKDILREEYDLLGLNFKLISNELINTEKMEYGLSDYICVPSEFSKKSFLDKGFNASKIKKISYGVNLKEFSAPKNIQQNKNFNIICVGSISVRKGIIYLIKAFNELNLANSNLTLIGDMERGFEKTVTPLLNSKIIVKKFISQNLLSKYYRQASVFVTCSIEEGLSMVQIQAMAWIAFNLYKNSGGEDLVDEGINGFVLPIRDKEGLKLNFLYKNKDILISMSKSRGKSKIFL